MSADLERYPTLLGTAVSLSDNPPWKVQSSTDPLCRASLRTAPQLPHLLIHTVKVHSTPGLTPWQIITSVLINKTQQAGPATAWTILARPVETNQSEGIGLRRYVVIGKIEPCMGNKKC